MKYYPRPKTHDEAAGWIHWNQENYARDGFGWWILHERGCGFVGERGLTWQTVNSEQYLEVGYHLLPAFQGRGLATEAAAACRDFARSQGFRRIIAITHPAHCPSQRVAERIGLSFERQTVHGNGAPIFIYGVSL